VVHERRCHHPPFPHPHKGPSILALLFSPRGGINDSNPGRLNGLETFVWGSIVTGVLGFLMSIASLLSIQVTSPITPMVSRGVAASLLGLYVFHDIITTCVTFLLSALYGMLIGVTASGQATSIAVILSGSALYTWFKHQESQ
jgi:solute carrier family 35 (GDP-fucose transporter), member C1